jgi:alkylation response protein AidB-like acyl-CoA dehydrogenase
MARTRKWILTEATLKRCRERAPVYDRENRFYSEDFVELRESGYLKMAVPKDFGGRGYSLAESCRETRRLAYYAPATALGTNMHVYWTGTAAEVHRSGDRSLDWLLEEAGQGEIFAAGHAETGNDLPVLRSTTKAERVDGGYRFTGRKSFGSMTPVWTRLGIHGMDTSDPKSPKIVHAFMPRSSEGFTIRETWDVLGMRATRSDDTLLEGVIIPDRYVARVVPAGAAGLDTFVLSIFAWGLLGFASVYYGLAQRISDIIIEALPKKASLAVSESIAHHPEVQRGVADIWMELESLGPFMDRVLEDWSDGVDHGPNWLAKIVTAKFRAVEACWMIADKALDLSGGFGMFKKNEMERLFRDARAGRFHPANAALTHELVAKTALGINPDAQPRWG